jgi:kynureninase
LENQNTKLQENCKYEIFLLCLHPELNTEMSDPAANNLPLTLESCQKLDRQDPLGSLRDRFSLPQSGALHFDANSIGAMPKDAPERVRKLMEDGWRELSRRGWAELDWLDKPRLLGEGLAHIIGADKEDVVVCDNTTVNLFKILSYAWRNRISGNSILTESHNFPTDIFVAEGLQDFLASAGQTVELDLADSPEEVMARLREDTAVLYLTHTDYRYSRRWNMAAMTKAAHDVGALVVWDLSHSAGAVEVDLKGSDADFAVSCGYKYLCGGPGSPALIYMHPRHRTSSWPTIGGWFGQADFMAFKHRYDPAPNVQGHNTGTPSVIANEIFACAADIWRDVKVADMVAKHKSLSQTAIALLEQECGDLGVKIISPKNYDEQGGHVAFSHPGAGAISEALFDRGMICSFRKPDSLRLGLSPLYHSHEVLWQGVALIREIIKTEAWRDPRFAKVAI